MILKRSIGLFESVMYGVGLIVGAGIYVIIGKAAGLAGNSLWLSFLIASFVVIAFFVGFGTMIKDDVDFDEKKHLNKKIVIALLSAIAFAFYFCFIKLLFNTNTFFYYWFISNDIIRS